jgi:hypothetical protein
MGFLITATILIANLGALFAQNAPAAPTDLGGWLTLVNVGLAGVGLIAFQKNWIVSGKTLEEAHAREAAQKAEIDKLHAHVDEVIRELFAGRAEMAKMITLTEKFVQLTEETDRLRKAIAANPPPASAG